MKRDGWKVINILQFSAEKHLLILWHGHSQHSSNHFERKTYSESYHSSYKNRPTGFTQAPTLACKWLHDCSQGHLFVFIFYLSYFHSLGPRNSFHTLKYANWASNSQLLHLYCLWFEFFSLIYLNISLIHSVLCSNASLSKIVPNLPQLFPMPLSSFIPLHSTYYHWHIIHWPVYVLFLPDEC